MEYNEKELIDKLTALEKDLTLIEKTKNTSMNIFDAVGMATQEIRHSAFLAFLLNPNKNHGLGKSFLSEFLAKLFKIKIEGIENTEVKNNAEILAEQEIKSPEDLKNFVDADDITVNTEREINSLDGRTDIFIRSEKAKTLVVIENKIFTSTHDDQLSKYEKDTKKIGGKRIHIYLTPNGDIPKDINGEYQKGWCIISYKAITDILKSLVKNLPKENKFKKIKFLMEDYIDMVETNVLKNNPQLRALCREISKKHEDAIKILMNYTDNTEKILAYLGEWFTKNLDVVYLFSKGKMFWFYTKAVEEYFKRHNRRLALDDSRRFGFQVGINYYADGKVDVLFGLGKLATEQWEESDILIKNIVMPSNQVMPTKYFTLYTRNLLSADENQGDIEVIKATLEKNLNKFLIYYKDFEKKLNAI